jgi:catechol 2,3-dioxygenase-like lactoylglutathione lyase family enzyme
MPLPELPSSSTPACRRRLSATTAQTAQRYVRYQTDNIHRGCANLWMSLTPHDSRCGKGSPEGPAQLPARPRCLKAKRSRASPIMTELHARVSSVVLASDARALAAFYAHLLGWTVVEQEGPRPGFPAEDGWVMIRPLSLGGDEAGLTPSLSLQFQWETDHVPPVRPPVPGKQQMMMHLDIAVEDLDAGVLWALEGGAVLAAHQPQEEVRVMLEPDGHPFCLWT